jgi:hypothetical protein
LSTESLEPSLLSVTRRLLWLTPFVLVFIWNNANQAASCTCNNTNMIGLGGWRHEKMIKYED